MDRVGMSRRIPAVILDYLFVLILVVIGVTLFATIGGARLGMEVQRSLGIEMTWRNLASQRMWTSYEQRIEEMADRFEDQIKRDFTPEQQRFIGDTFTDTLESEFLPTHFSLQYFLDLDERDLNRMVDTAFAAVAESDEMEIDPQKLQALQMEAHRIIDQFGIATLVPKAIDFAIWLVLLPSIIFVAYGFSEALFGRTLGKLAVGIGIRRADGERAYVSHYMLRYAIKNSAMLIFILALATRVYSLFIVAGIAAAVVLIGSLAAFGPDRRTLHDYLSNTAVFRARGSGEW